MQMFDTNARSNWHQGILYVILFLSFRKIRELLNNKHYSVGNPKFDCDIHQLNYFNWS